MAADKVQLVKDLTLQLNSSRYKDIKHSDAETMGNRAMATVKDLVKELLGDKSLIESEGEKVKKVLQEMLEVYRERAQVEDIWDKRREVKERGVGALFWSSEAFIRKQRQTLCDYILIEKSKIVAIAMVGAALGSLVGPLYAAFAVVIFPATFLLYRR